MNLKQAHTAVMAVFVLGLLLLTGTSVVRADEIVVDIRDLYEGDLVVDGFELKSATRLNVMAIGAQVKHSDDMYAYCWILDADEREPVWVMENEDTKRRRGSKNIREFEGEINLQAGRYEVYYYAGQPYFFSGMNIKIDDFEEAIGLLEKIFDDGDEDYEYYSEETEDLMLMIEAPEGSFTKFVPVDEHGRNVVVSFVRPEDNYHEEKGFTLDKEMTLKIIAIGEYYSSGRVFVDFGWIIDADSREKVWKMDKWNTSWAGGGRKNRCFYGEITLPAGNYIAHYVTDDSHCFGGWNAPPPYDPLHYGMIITTTGGDLKHARSFEDDYSEPTIVSLTRIRDGQFKKKGFTLKTEASVHIIALGEYGYTDEFVDYGWIEGLDDDNVYWEMTEDNTDYAGGATKNRMFDGIVKLPAGSYMVHYASDDSHSYRRWNDSPPYDQKMWGITVYGAGRDFDTSLVETFTEAPVGTGTLVAITGVGDDEDIQESFTLDSPQKVHIYALGEGQSGEMFDYGWIENARNGDIVWEMTYRKSRHAGGARKNRFVDTHILLEAGEYDVYYVTDGSHSFPDFNASRPNRAHKWGITITKE